MKKLLSLLSLILMLSVVSCSKGANESADPNLTPHEREAIKEVKKHIEKHETLEAYEVYTGPMPAALLADEFKGYRDKVYKDGLDYVNCLKRGLNEHAAKKAEDINEAQQEIVAKTNQWNIEQGTSEYLFVLATLSSRNQGVQKQSKLIAVFNPVTMQRDFWLPVTTPIVNTAALILNAENGTLFEYATDPSHDTAALSKTIENPVLRFIFDAPAETIR